MNRTWWLFDGLAIGVLSVVLAWVVVMAIGGAP